MYNVVSVKPSNTFILAEQLQTENGTEPEMFTQIIWVLHLSQMSKTPSLSFSGSYP